MDFLKDYHTEDKIALSKTNQLNWIVRILCNSQDYLTDYTKNKLKFFAQNLKAEVEQNQTAKQRFISNVGAIPDERIKKVFFLHYLEGMTFKSISKELHICEKQILRFHSRGLSIMKAGT